MIAVPVLSKRALKPLEAERVRRHRDPDVLRRDRNGSRTVGPFVRVDEPRKASGEPRRWSRGPRYDTGADGPVHPLTGRWMPDLALKNGTGPTRVAELMRTAKPVLLDLADRAGLEGRRRLERSWRW